MSDADAGASADRGTRLPLIAGAAAVAGLAGWVVVAGQNARRRVLGVKLPRTGSRSPTEVVGAGVREVGHRVASLPGVGAARQKIGL